MLTLITRLINSSDCSQLALTDTTAAYNVGNNPGGWGAPNISTAEVGSVFLGGTYQEDNSTPAVNIPTFLLMPTVSYPGPYQLPQGFLLTPSMLGMTTTTFPAGIYILTYTVWQIIGMTFVLGGGSPNVAVGDIMTDSDGNQYKILTTNGTTQATFALISGTTIVGAYTVPFNCAPSGAFGMTATIFNLDIAANPISSTVTQQFLVKCSLDCCIGQKLSALTNCGCNKEDIDELFENFMELMAAEAQVGCLKNNEALDTIEELNDFCQDCGCGCS